MDHFFRAAIDEVNPRRLPRGWFRQQRPRDAARYRTDGHLAALCRFVSPVGAQEGLGCPTGV